MTTNRTSRMHSPHRQMTIDAFSRDVFGHLPRQDQRRWAETYLRGLIGTPGKKSVRRMAAAVSGGPTASQSLHQFVSASPWPWDPSRRALADWARQRAAVRAWSLVPVVAPKRGEHSVGVHRRFDPAAGRVINCQAGIGLLLSGCCGDVPVDWRLHLPDVWCRDQQLRRRARIPDSGDARPLWALGMELVDTQMCRHEGPPPPVVADARELLDTASLVNGLSNRGLKFIVTVSGTLVVRGGPHLGSQWRAGTNSLAARLCVVDRRLQRGAPSLVTTARDRHRHTAAMWTLSGPVHLPHGQQTMRLLAKWHPMHPSPARVWLTNIADIDALQALARTQAGVGAAMQTLRERFGLLDFEGRSFPGWHHHMTLVSAAYGWHLLSGSAPDRHVPTDDFTPPLGELQPAGS
ncbi:IS701 family transposase [Streptomyces sp. NPDC056149]|uniref:IS701 family transposase n=1 Tax=Streptomyces sp. NPDC056149 TaxID=3345728 RepID=UPI0035D7EFA9